MPEGPELHMSGIFVNRFCEGRIFSGKVEKSAVSTKNPDVDWDEPSYKIQTSTRGKQIRLTLTAIVDGTCDENEGKIKKKAKAKASTAETGKQISIRINFGMSGKFIFRKRDEMDKHCHLNFFSRDEDMVLCFNDYRRFGRWEVTDEWGQDRGPCIILEYDLFRKNVLENLPSTLSKKPICEVMLNQKYFSGIGNYLRAEILYRLSIPPFVSTESVINPLREADEAGVKTEQDKDFLRLCHTVSHEVINLKGANKYIYDPSLKTEKDINTFMDWLQCYYKDGMSNMVDSHGRTIWFSGKPGPLKPNNVKTRGRVMKYKPKAKSKAKDDDSEEEEVVPAKKARKAPSSTKKAKTGKTTDKKEQKATKRTSKKVEKSSSESSSNTSRQRKERPKGSRVQPRRSCTKAEETLKSG